MAPRQLCLPKTLASEALMNAAFYLKLYALTVPVFFIIDLIWLGAVAKGFYQKNLSFILSPQVNWPAAILFYLLYIAGILIFAVVPAVSKDSWQHAMVYGALFGFFTYMTYELTNLALLKDWPLNIVVVDIIWGVVLCTAVATLSFILAKWLL
jgi:uncharacterized membrane protein